MVKKNICLSTKPSRRWKRSGAGYGKRESCPANKGKVASSCTR
jgi:hypothetical protein